MAQNRGSVRLIRWAVQPGESLPGENLTSAAGRPIMRMPLESEEVQCPSKS